MAQQAKQEDTTMEPSLDGCRAKLQRAESHLSVLESEFAAFREQYPIRITVDRDVVRSTYIFRAWRIRQPDPQWGLIVGDAAHNARSALDHLAYQLLIVGLGRDLTPKESGQVMFPIADSANRFRSSADRHLVGLRAVDIARIEVLQSYNAWNESIWGALYMPGPPAPVPSYLAEVSHLDNVDKHRVVQPVWFTTGFSALPSNAKALGITGSSSPNAPLSEGAEIGIWHFDRTPPEPPDEIKTYMHAYFPTQVSLREPFFGTRVGRILGNCIMAVRMVIDMFEPVISHGGDPAPLRYWDGQPPWL